VAIWTPHGVSGPETPHCKPWPMTLPAALERQVWQLTLMLFICRLLAGSRRSDFDRRYTWSNLSLFRHFQGVIDLNPQVSHSALQFCMSEQQLNRPQVLRPAIDQ